MYKVFWLCFHSIMCVIMAVVWMFTEIADGGKEVVNDFKNKDKRFDGESCVVAGILGIFVIALYIFIYHTLMENTIFSKGFVVIYFLVLGYIAIRQIIKMLFVHEKRDFSISDIRGFAFTYLFWWIIISIMSSPQAEVNLLDKSTSDYGEIIKVVLLWLCNYFNILLALGGAYILLYYLGGIRKILKKICGCIKNAKPKHKLKIFDWSKTPKKFFGLKSYRIWKEDEKRVIFKIIMTIPLFLLDVWNIFWFFVVVLVKALVSGIIDAILEPIRGLYILVKGVWNRYENTEWMYVFAQIAGLCSYCIVFVIVQYGGFGDEVKSVYEFAGTVILIPYFLDKINKHKEKKIEKTE